MWFDLKMSVNNVKNIGADFICLLNNITKIFCNGNINNMAKDLP